MLTCSPSLFSMRSLRQGCLEPRSVWAEVGPTPPAGLDCVLFPGWAPQGQCQHLIYLKGRHKCRMYVSLGWGS